MLYYHSKQRYLKGVFVNFKRKWFKNALIIGVVFSFIICGYFIVFQQPVTPHNTTETPQRLRKILEIYFVPFEIDDQFLVDNKDKIALGKRLFYDERLSDNAKVSCNSCHDLNNYGTNGSYYLEQKSNNLFFRDVPSIYNVSTLPLYNADGGLIELKEKIKQSITSTHEMGVTDTLSTFERLKMIEAYKSQFETVYSNDDAISLNTVSDALQAFIIGLITPAPIDKFIKGDDAALTNEQIEGGHLFSSKNCYSCHTGSNIGGQMIQKLGI